MTPTPEVQENLAIEAKPEPLPERRFIEDVPRAEIMRLFKIFSDQAQVAYERREEFIGFINMVREQMGIDKDGGFWDIAEDASYFERRGLPQAGPPQEGTGVVAVDPLATKDPRTQGGLEERPAPPLPEYVATPPPPPTANALTGEGEDSALDVITEAPKD